MIQLEPILEIPRSECPKCHSQMTASGWLITGMRNLADLNCPGCKSEFYGDLPTGQALYTPMLIDKKSGKVYDDYNVGWFTEWFFDAYANRTNESLIIKVRNFSKLKERVILLNCLDAI